MKQIKLTQGKFAIVDNKDYSWLMQWKWHFAQGYAKRTSSRLLGPQRKIAMHRELNQTPEGFDTDHINGNGLDNRRRNLRSVTRSLNGLNRKKLNTNNSSGERNVTWHSRSKKWIAKLGRNNKTKHIGYFNSIDAARQALAKELKNETK